MSVHPRSAMCERARAWASLRLDAELSEFEDALLVAHLGRCSACSEYEESVRGAVLALRNEPLAGLEHPVSVPSRGPAVLWPTALARAAAVVAIAVGIATVLTSQSAHRLPASPVPSLGAAGDGDLNEIRLLRVTQLGATPQQGARIGVHGALLQGPARQ